MGFLIILQKGGSQLILLGQDWCIHSLNSLMFLFISLNEAWVFLRLFIAKCTCFKKWVFSSCAVSIVATKSIFFIFNWVILSSSLTIWALTSITTTLTLLHALVTCFHSCGTFWVKWIISSFFQVKLSISGYDERSFCEIINQGRKILNPRHSSFNPTMISASMVVIRMLNDLVKRYWLSSLLTPIENWLSSIDSYIAIAFSI